MLWLRLKESRIAYKIEPDARMVEIGVYSTVGTSAWVADILRNVGVKCGKDAVEVCGTAEETGDKRRERCSEDCGVFALCKIPTHGG